VLVGNSSGRPGWMTPLLQLVAGGALGLASLLVVVPGRVLKGGAEAFITHEDQKLHVAALRYFVWDDWRWPLTRTSRLGGEEGTVIVFTDAMPVYGLALRLVRWAISPEFNFLGVWFALCYALQGMAAVAAARMWRATRWAHCLAAAAIAVSMPAWLVRTVHAALSFHAPLLLGCGLLGLAGRRPPARVAAAGLVLCWWMLATNAYLFVMQGALTLALLAQLARRGWGRRRALVALAALGAGSLLEMWVLGYFTPHGPGVGFNYFSMNLLSPIHPPASALLGRVGGDVDATGGQYEGFNYLGLGLLGLVALAGWSYRHELNELASRRRPELLAGLALTVFALSNQVYLGKRLLLNLPPPPAVVTQLRAPGRFFWPVSYLVLIGVVALLARRGRRFERALVAAALVQWIDVAGLRMAQRRAFEHRPELLLGASAWVPAIAAHRRVEVSPSWECADPARTRGYVDDLVLLASIPRTTVSTVRSARPLPASCDALRAAFDAGRGIDENTLVVALGDTPLPPRLAGWRCAVFSGGIACSGRPEADRLLAPIGPVGATRARERRVP
jgi:hypothetical protein